MWGRGMVNSQDPERQTSEDRKSGGCQSCGDKGMASWAVHSMLVSLNIMDTPVGYVPPRGPSAQFTVTYNQRESFQPQIFPYWNLGPRWTNDWMAYVTDDPVNGAQPATVYLRAGAARRPTGGSTARARATRRTTAPARGWSASRALRSCTSGA